jgi:type IV secretion system protein VirB10
MCAFVLRASFACAALAPLSEILPTLNAADIPKGTHVLLRLENSITTRTAQPGDMVYLRTASPIIVNSRVVTPAGCYAQGAVTSVKRGGRVSGRAELGLRLDTLALANGRVWRFSGAVDSVDAQGTGQKAQKEEGIVRQAPDRGRDAGTIAVTGGEGGLARVLLTRGRDVELRRGSTIDVVLDRPLTIE